MNIPTPTTLGRAVAILALLAGPALGDTIVLTPTRDNTLYEDDGGALSNGQHVFIYAGRTGDMFGEGSPSIRRALIRFDPFCEIPPGSTITAATLRLYMSQAPLANPRPQEFCLARVARDWGEGTSDSGPFGGGAGWPAAPGDATWLHTFYPSELWTLPGGDFSIVADACEMVTNVIGDFEWSTDDMRMNVQDWIDNPDTNFGWLLRGPEFDEMTARRFGSRQNSDVSRRPRLEISFTTPPDCSGDADGSGVVDIDDIVAVILQFGMPVIDCIVSGDVDGDGDVDIDDIVEVVLNFGDVCF